MAQRDGPRGGSVAAPTADEDKGAALDRTAELLECFCAVAAIDAAWCTPSQGDDSAGELDVLVFASQRNLAANTVRRHISFVQLSLPGGTHRWSPFPFELSPHAAACPSPSGSRLFIAKNGDGSGKEGPAAVKLELWGGGRLLKEIHVPPAVHGAVYNDKWFEGMSWNEEESQVAYIAEEPTPSKPVFGRYSVAVGKKKLGHDDSEQPKEDESAGSEAGSWKGRGEWKEDWGERYTGKARPVVFVLDIPSGQVEAMRGLPEDLSAGQVVWAPYVASAGKPQTLVFVGWPSAASNFQTPKKLGMVYCYNRPCYLYTASAPTFSSMNSSGEQAETNIAKLTSKISSAYYPCFSPDGRQLVFLSANAAVDSGAHAATNSLHSLEWPVGGSPELSSIRTIVNVVQCPETEDAFPGLYATNLLARPWITNGSSLVVGTAWRSTLAIVEVDVASGSLERISPAGSEAWSLLAAHGDVLIAAVSTPISPAKLMLGIKEEGKWSWSHLPKPSVEYATQVENIMQEASFEILKIEVPRTEQGRNLSQGGSLPFEAILVRGQPEPAPLLVVPHGGPHGVTTTSFVMSYLFLASLGYHVVHVNYRGSTGFGEEALQSLPGHVGKQDVADILSALAIVKEYVKDDRVAVVGGSHGGFLAAHLISQAPRSFKTAVLRNPVCNLASMMGVTDIADWCFTETFGGVTGLSAYTEAPGSDVLKAFHDASPIALVDKIEVPTLFLLGAQDRRVPYFNGLQFVHALRARNLEAKVLIFPEDNHAIDKPQSEFEHWVNVAVWLKEHL